jgi:LCP family protein required for cell wall assembly
VANRRFVLTAVATLLVLASGLAVVALRSSGSKPIVVGKTDQTTSTPPATAVMVPEEAAPADPGATEVPAGGGGLKAPNGRPYPPAIEFRSSIPVRSDLTFILVVGSDARPREDVRTSRADSIHLLAVNPVTGQGTVVGFPRDAYVEIPGRGRGKINDALVRGGPRLMAETVRRVTGLPVHYYVLTGFEGMVRMVDELGGVDVHVERSMNDSASGARFQAGWHHFTGAEALAFTRNRKDVPNGDFSRSENQGKLILAALAKMRAEVGDDVGLLRWTGVLSRHVDLDVPADELPRLGALARRLDPARVVNLVLPGRIGMAGRASVVYLTPEAFRIFDDLRPDAVVGGAVDRPPPPPPPPATTTTTRPSPSPSPPPTQPPPPPPTTQPPPQPTPTTLPLSPRGGAT